MLACVLDVGSECVCAMPNKCIVDGCTSPPDGSLHRFPKDEGNLRQWKQALGKPVEWMPIENERVCTHHFDPAVVAKCGQRTRLLGCPTPRIASYETTTNPRTNINTDHNYALPDPTILKRRLDILLDKVESDGREKDYLTTGYIELKGRTNFGITF